MLNLQKRNLARSLYKIKLWVNKLVITCSLRLVVLLLRECAKRSRIVDD